MFLEYATKVLAMDIVQAAFKNLQCGEQLEDNSTPFTSLYMHVSGKENQWNVKSEKLKVEETQDC